MIVYIAENINLVVLKLVKVLKLAIMFDVIALSETWLNGNEKLR